MPALTPKKTKMGSASKGTKTKAENGRKAPPKKKIPRTKKPSKQVTSEQPEVTLPQLNPSPPPAIAQGLETGLWIFLPETPIWTPDINVQAEGGKMVSNGHVWTLAYIVAKKVFNVLFKVIMKSDIDGNFLGGSLHLHHQAEKAIAA